MTVDEQVRVETMGMRLGYLDLIPFMVGVTALLSQELVSLAFQAFILALTRNFIIHGGRSLGLGSDYRDPTKHTTLNIRIPVVAAWICLIALPAPLTLAALGGGFIAQWFIDRPILAELPIPSWYLEMRPRLAYVVAGCHIHAVPNDELITAAVNEFRV